VVRMCSVLAWLGVTIRKVIACPTEYPPQMPPEAQAFESLDLHVLCRTARTAKLHLSADPPIKDLPFHLAQEKMERVLRREEFLSSRSGRE
jgi:hypothetical protein